MKLKNEPLVRTIPPATLLKVARELWPTRSERKTNFYLDVVKQCLGLEVYRFREGEEEFLRSTLTTVTWSHDDD